MSGPYEPSCHCRAIRLKVDAPLEGLVECNCSTCRRFGAAHWYVDGGKVTLIDESRAMASYVWRHVHESHQFCPTCGASILRAGYPNGVIALNACLIEDVDVFTLEKTQFNGRHKIPPGPLP